ncbi:hypothetical protein GCM10020000_35750 [Streptomyces olivoverticillatus]
MGGHVRRWAGIMIAVILVKPIIVIVLGLAGALSSGKGPNSFSAVVSGLAIIILAIFASAMIYRFVPGFGDEIISSRNASNDVASRRAAAVISSPAALVKQGITTHSARGNGGGGGGGQQTAPRPSRRAAVRWRRRPQRTARRPRSVRRRQRKRSLRPCPRTAGAEERQQQQRQGIRR